MAKKNNTSIQAWVTRQSAFSIQCGGIERLTVHFSKPVYIFEKFKEADRDTPFGYISECEGGLYKKHGWFELNKKCYMGTLSVGQWLGYDNPVSEFIWQKLQEHFKNEPFDNWHLLEQSGECRIEDFLVEMELSLSINV